MEKKLKIPIIAVLVIAIISLGVAFAAFSTTLNINGSAQIEASSWNIVFEGLTNNNSLDDPDTNGSGTEITHPTIKNNSTEIGNYEVSLATPGDSVTYNFKIHNRGDYAARVTNVIMNQGVNLTTNTSKRTSEAATLNAIEYRFYYTDNNQLVGSGDSKDCLAPGDEVNVSLRIVFSSLSETDTSVLPSEDLVLDNLGINVIYTQESSCSSQSGGGTSGGSGGNEEEENVCEEYSDEILAAGVDGYDVYIKEVDGVNNICLLFAGDEHCYTADEYTFYNNDLYNYYSTEDIGCNGDALLIHIIPNSTINWDTPEIYSFDISLSITSTKNCVEDYVKRCYLTSDGQSGCE